ncbi:hypothetical protein CASFOL_003945 [Castilleja foliolosa]|uniref:Uncharacterized protein n=1 Tax=Castilleja foliolosa TaxID=1961234 RepID=A0ABD3ELZ2_9LAMI
MMFQSPLQVRNFGFTAGLDTDYSFSGKSGNGGGFSEYDGQLSSGVFNSASSGPINDMMDERVISQCR